MWKEPDWDNGNYMEWADQERLVRQDLEEINRDLRRRKAENYMEAEYAGINATGEAEPGNNRAEL